MSLPFFLSFAPTASGEALNECFFFDLGGVLFPLILAGLPLPFVVPFCLGLVFVGDLVVVSAGGGIVFTTCPLLCFGNLGCGF